VASEAATPSIGQSTALESGFVTSVLTLTAGTRRTPSSPSERRAIDK
jgi:hypothetical protein